jgi:uncharacterized protein YceH (UPF0502 family)
MELTPEEIRVLGCLVEKEATTPDNYPLSTNALVNACNQTTNRDPVVDYSEREVDQLMISLREQGLARTVRGDGQRVHKHKHVLGDAINVDRGELALLSVLMLRGAQTTAELRTRTERYGTDHDTDAIERTLRSLSARDTPLTRVLDRRPGEREARWVHLLGGEALAAEIAAAPAAAGGSSAVRSSPTRSSASADEVIELRARVDELERRFATLLERLGESID